MAIATWIQEIFGNQNAFTATLTASDLETAVLNVNPDRVTSIHLNNSGAVCEIYTSNRRPTYNVSGVLQEAADDLVLVKTTEAADYATATTGPVSMIAVKSDGAANVVVTVSQGGR